MSIASIIKPCPATTSQASKTKTDSESPKSDENSSIYFKHSPKPTDKTIVLKFGGREYYRFSPQIIQMYFLSRNAVFKSYTVYNEKASLHHDILDFNKQKQYEPEILLETNSLFQYSIKAAKETAQSWKTGEIEGSQANCFLAYYGNKQIGFVQFCKLKDPITSEEVIYIAQLAVDPQWQRKSIGKNLMLKIIKNYPTKTTFYVLTRKFNEGAENLYIRKLGFSKFIDKDEFLIEYLGYNKNLYSGYKYTS